jgi:hypothetical protein
MISATLLEASDWYKVKLANGVVGYVSKAWTEIEQAPSPVAHFTCAASAGT